MELGTLLTRLLLIIFLSFLIGLEREFRHQPAGLRTHILIWLWSALIMILSIEVAAMSSSSIADPGRIAAQVVTGIWFIWAGAIMKIGFNTKWLTTAANIWVTSAIWLTVWAGLYALAILATILILFNLIVIDKIKLNFLKKSRYCIVKLIFEKKRWSHKKIINTIQALNFNITGKDIKETKDHISIKLVIKIEKDTDTYDIHQIIHTIPHLIKTYISENIH